MPTPTIIIQPIQCDQMMNDINVMLQRLIVDDTHEFEFLGGVGHGLTPRIKVELWEQLNTIVRNLIGEGHPIILKNIVNNAVMSLDAAIYALFSVRNKNTFTALEIKTYLYNHLESLLDERNYSSMLGNYIIMNGS